MPQQAGRRFAGRSGCRVGSVPPAQGHTGPRGSPAPNGEVSAAQIVVQTRSGEDQAAGATPGSQPSTSRTALTSLAICSTSSSSVP